MSRTIRVGMGGWTYEPWRGAFYPADLPQRRELEFASRAVTSIEINGTYYSLFKPDDWRKWRDETPDDFVFAVRGSRFCTNRKILATAAQGIANFFGQGITQMGGKLGPVNWQFTEHKEFDAGDFSRFLELLPREKDGVALHHAVEVRHPSFETPAFYELAARHEVAIVNAKGEGFPEIDQPTASFTYARFMTTREDLETGHTIGELKSIAQQARDWANRGDVFLYFISGAKVRNPAAAQALIRELG